MKIEPIHLKSIPMEDAIAFWSELLLLTPEAFRALSDAARAKAFSVAGLAREDQLQTVYDAIQRAIAEGTTFADFKADLGPIMEKRGWAGYRADNIFRTNLQTAYNVGRYREMTEAVAERPYWQYSAVNDSRTRPTHAALHGKVFPADHPFWDTWYPPNGYRCRCSVVSLSRAEIERDGLTVETEDPTGKLIRPFDPEGNELPARNLMPDPGWDHHPGKAAGAEGI